MQLCRQNFWRPQSPTVLHVLRMFKKKYPHISVTWLGNKERYFEKEKFVT